MTNLYIIGNGFDLAHGMKTKYSDFKNFLIETYLSEYNCDWNSYEIPYPKTYPDGDEIYDEKIVVSTIIQILNSTEKTEKWNDIETSLGKLNYDDFLDKYGLFDDMKTGQIYSINMDMAKNLCGAIKQIDKYFHAWIKTIDIPKNPILKFDSDDLFLNFNYTKTLEYLYNIKNVCHIHGTQDNEIYFGHGNDKHDTDNIQRKFFGAEEEINKLQDSLRKNTVQAYKNNKKFFENIYKIAQEEDFSIYEYGFSFSFVDRFYLENIFKNINTKKIIFYLHKHHEDNKEDFSTIIRNCGFEGKISIYKKNKYVN